MARYYFHSVDGGRKRDTLGTELPNDGEARREAVSLIAGIMHDDPAILQDGHDYRIEVTDETGCLLFTVVTLAITPTGADTA